MEKFKTLNETELISVVGGKPKKKRSLCPYVATGMAVAGGIFTGGKSVWSSRRLGHSFCYTIL